MMKTKELHYTPTIEEFHVGFEYEWMREGEGATPWTKTILGRDNGPISDIDAWNGNEYRVKCLDKDDVLDFGFTLIEEVKSPFTGFPTHKFHLNHEEGFNTGTDYYLELLDSNVVQLRIYTYGSYYTFDNTMLFNIKNKSELSKLLVQVGFLVQ